MVSAPLVRGLTLWRPWAAAIVHGPKAVENRHWPAPQASIDAGLWIAVHAGRTYDLDAARFILARWPDVRDSIPHGDRQGVVGVAKVLRAVRAEDLETPDPWAVGPWCWMLGFRRALPRPIPCRGAQGLWTLPPEVLAAVLPLCVESPP